MGQRRPRFGYLFVIGLAIIAVGCTSSPRAQAQPIPSASATTPSSPSPSAAVSPSAVPSTVTGSTPAGPASVDLVFTGWRAVTAKGTAGVCSQVHFPSGALGFLYRATVADYAGLGTGFNITEGSPGSVDLKWAIGSGLGYASPAGSGIQLSADDHTVTLDLDLTPVHPSGLAAPGPEHAKGTVTCP